ncbi:MAG: outer membrane protein assembly factor BamB family protein [Methanobacteriota archaeon]
MGLRPVFGIALVLLAAAPGATADFLQSGLDGARTGAVAGPPLEHDDVAWVVQLPGARPGTGKPLLVRGAAYVAAFGVPDSPTLTTNGIFRIPLEDPVPELLQGFDEAPVHIASDGERVFAILPSAVIATSLVTGLQEWRWDFPAFQEVRNTTNCLEPAVDDGVVYVACTEAGYVAPTTGPASTDCRAVGFVAAVDAANGAVRWTWNKATPNETNVQGLSVLGDIVVVVTRDFGGASGVFDRCGAGDKASARTVLSEAWALSPADGTPIWNRPLSFVKQSGAAAAQALPLGVVRDAVPPPPPLLSEVLPPVAYPTGTASVIYGKVGEVFALNARGDLLWNTTIGKEDTFNGDTTTGFALLDDALFVGSLQTIYRFDTTTHAERWRITLDPRENNTWGSGPNLLVAGNRLYARAARTPVPNANGVNIHADNPLYALSADTGRVLWQRTFTPPLEILGRRMEWAMDDGRILVAAADGTVTLLGTTAASMRPAAAVSTEYPAPGAEVDVDLSSSAAGAQGAPTSFRIEWGDGAVSDWQPSPVFRHAYADRGDFAARLQTANDAGQSASTFVVFRVGTPPPVALNPVQQAVSGDNLDVTLAVAGLVGTGVVTMIGVYRVQRRRNLLTTELHALEADYVHLRATPPQCESMLHERKIRTRAFLLNGRLEENQAQILDKRIDELSRQARLHTLDERFDFLPHGMVKMLQGILEDGHVSAWERRHFHDALERDTLLTPEQKRKVEDLIEAWFAHDSGAGSG